MITELLGYPAALLVGVSLGLIGAGGAILTIPVLVYLFHIPAHVATSYSLFLVGFTALAGSVGYIRNRLLSYNTALIFGLTSVSAVFLTRKFIFPAIPERINLGYGDFSKDKLILIVFSVIMMFASYSMIRSSPMRRDRVNSFIKTNGTLMLLLNGLAVGVISGLVGAGGGFLIIPALVLIQELPMKTAVGTSLLIIAVNSFLGFSGDLGHVEINWTLLITLCALSLTGILIGITISKKVPGVRLKPLFGWFILIMGVYILLRSY